MIRLQDIQLIIQRLSKKEKGILYVAAAVISLVLLDRLIISPVYSRMRSLDDAITQKEAAIRRDLRVVAQKDKITAESKKYDGYTGSLASEEEEVAALLKEVERLANKASVYLIDIKPAGSKTAGTSKRYLANLNCEAQMEQITDFMYQIENSNKLLTIEKYQISPKSKESSVARCSVTVSKIMLP